MQWIRVGAASLNQTPLDWSGNLGRLLETAQEAKSRSVSILLTPELCLTGYGCEDAFFGYDIQSRVEQGLLQIARESHGLAIAVGTPWMMRNCLYNAAFLLFDGLIVGAVAKAHLAGDGVHYEPRWFKPWPKGVQDGIEIGGREVPFGDLIFDLGGIRIGFEICEDAWTPERRSAGYVSHGVDVILNPSASHFSIGKSQTRQRIVSEGARAQCAAYAYANLLGNEAGRIIYDGATLIASAGGKILAKSKSFSFKPWQLVTADIDIAQARLERARNHNHHFTKDPARYIVNQGAWLNTLDPKVRHLEEPDLDDAQVSPEEEFTHAVALGLFDSLRKSGSQGYVVSLSGGADSSAVAILAALSLKLAAKELGLKEAATRLGGDLNPDDLKDRLLCVYQATSNNSVETGIAAQTLAEALGAWFVRWEIDSLVKGYRELAEHALGVRLDWKKDDIALQNIQARSRAPGVWLLANLRNALLLSTSNRSEAAVGYATMDGDTAGGLAPIAGIGKSFLMTWLEWMRLHGPVGIGPIPEIARVLDQDPSAELRPLTQQQRDEEDLMPYVFLDRLEEHAIRDKRSPADCLDLLLGEFLEYSASQKRQWVIRFFHLWGRNQWKRERYAPSFHLDDENLDPKTWCRFPILSGNFDCEIRELERSKINDHTS